MRRLTKGNGLNSFSSAFKKKEATKKTANNLGGLLLSIRLQILHQNLLIIPLILQVILLLQLILILLLLLLLMISNVNLTKGIRENRKGN